MTVEREAQIASSGLTPLEFMLQILRDKTKEDAARMYAAVHAAPYCHPKLAPVDKDGAKDIAGEWTVVRLSELIDADTAGNDATTTRLDPKGLPAPSGEAWERNIKGTFAVTLHSRTSRAHR